MKRLKPKPSPFLSRAMTRAVVVLCLLSLILSTTRPAAAGCGGGGWFDFATTIVNPMSAFDMSTEVGCAADGAKEAIIEAGNQGERVVMAAGNQAMQVVRLAGYQAESFAETLGDEAVDVIMTGSNEAQHVITTAGDTANNVIHTAGAEAQAVFDSMAAEAEQLVLIAGGQAQQFAHVAGSEARATAAEIGAQSREVVMLISDKSMQAVSLAGEEARAVVRVAGEEARLTLEQFHRQNEELLRQINESYRGNLDFTIDSLDEASRAPLVNAYDALLKVNRLLAHDLLLIESSTIEVIAAAGDELALATTQLEAGTKDVILVAGQTAIYVVDRVTNNVITVTAIILTALGLLLLIYLFFVHRLPQGVAARFVSGFMIVYPLGFGSLILSPSARVYAMRSAQVGLRSELQRATGPQVIKAQVILGDTGNAQPRIEISGRNLLAADNPPLVTLSGRTMTVGGRSDGLLTVNLSAGDVTLLHAQTAPLTIDYGRPDLQFTIDLRLADPFDAIRHFTDESIPATLRAVPDGEVPVHAGDDPTTYERLGTLQPGIDYAVIGRNPEHSWWAIRWPADGGEREGWVPAHLVILSGDLFNALPATPAAPTVTPTPTATAATTATPTATATPAATPTLPPSPTPCVWTLTATVNAFVRNGPGQVYLQIGALRTGDTVATTGRSHDGAWWVITYGDRPGWVADSVVNVNTCAGDPPPAVDAPPTPVPSPTPIITYRSCAEIRAARPDAGDDFYLLYFQGDVNKPFNVYCRGMASAPAEYLPLAHYGVGGRSNYNLFKVGGATEGQDQYEYFAGIRLDPFTLEVDAADFSYAEKVGYHSFRPGYEGNRVRRSNFGEARSCVARDDRSGRANVDLRGTPFALDATTVAKLGGWESAGFAWFSPDRRVAELEGGGFCGAMALRPIRLVYVGR